jgi:DNA (cytosine-5)-methyltransferase 1
MINIIDLFAGCGGLTDGFLKTEHFRTLAAVDWEHRPIETLQNRLVNRYGYSFQDVQEKVFYFDIQRTEELLYGFQDEHYGQSEGLNSIVGDNNVDLIIGGPPCQAYSVAGRVQDKNGMRDDYRNYLFESYVKIVDHFKPKFFIFENVPGILSARPGGDLITDRIRSSFNDVGYLIPEDLKTTALFDLSSFGIPQKRKRVIIFGVRKEDGEEQLELFYRKMKSCEQEKQKVAWEAIGDLPDLFPASDGSNKRISHSCDSKNSFKNHIPRFHNDRDIKIFKILSEDIQCGACKLTSTEALRELYKEHTGRESKFHKYHVIRKDLPSNTIPAHLYKDGLRHIHPDPKQSRSITVREAARLQSFDDDFEFFGSLGDQFRMVGNAVPPQFSTLLAETIFSLFQEAKETCFTKTV